MSRERPSITARLSWLLGFALLGQHVLFLCFAQASAPLYSVLALIASVLAGVLGSLWLARAGAELRALGPKLHALAESAEPARAAAHRGDLGSIAVELSILGKRLDESRTLRARAREASAYKASFLRSVRHELRTPLNSILGFSDVLLGGLEGPLTEDQRENLAVIRTSAARLSQLFEEVIELTLLAADQRPRNEEQLDPAAVIDAVADALENDRGDRPVHIRRALDGDLRPVLGDGERLRKLLLCVARHALEHAAGPVLVLGAEAEEASDVLYVRDPARVLTEAEMLALRSDDPTARARRKGLGEDARLLVRLCDRVALEHHGQARFESDTQQGTRYSLCLPLAATRASAQRAVSSGPASERDSSTSSNGDELR